MGKVSDLLNYLSEFLFCNGASIITRPEAKAESKKIAIVDPDKATFFPKTEKPEVISPESTMVNNEYRVSDVSGYDDVVSTDDAVNDMPGLSDVMGSNDVENDV